MPETLEKGGALDRLLPILLVATVGLAFVVGVLWQKVKNLEGGGVDVLNVETEDLGEQANLPAQGKLSEEQASKIIPITDDDHIRGSIDARVFLIEYSDFECPFCQSFHPAVQQAMENYGELAWVYRHFPLTSIHPNAQPAAEASECAAELGGSDAFWSFTDQLFEGTPESLAADEMTNIAANLGINTDDFTSCLDSGRHKEKVENQQNGGFDAGIVGTPGSFIVNEQGEAWILPGAVDFEDLQLAIDEALAD